MTMLCFAILARHEFDPTSQIMQIRDYYPDSFILLYDPDMRFTNGADATITRENGAIFKQGRYLYDCMRYLQNHKIEYDYLVSLDFDVLPTQQGFEQYVENFLQTADCMSINMTVQHSASDLPHWITGQHIWSEWAIWQRYLRGASFCSAFRSLQVYPFQLVQKMLNLLEQDEWEELINRTDVQAFDEVLYPSLEVMAGATIATFSPQESECICVSPLPLDQFMRAKAIKEIFLPAPIRNTPPAHLIQLR